MIALYGTQARYAPEVKTRGVYRDSAAVFLLPDFPERGMARRTLACAIYHAIGSPLLRETIQHGQSLSAVLEKSAGGVCLICIRGIAEGEWRTDRYTLSDGETYAYVKLRESGPVDSEEKRSICLAPSIFEARIDSTDGTSGLRFFRSRMGKHNTFRAVICRHWNGSVCLAQSRF